jgi:hypothetical protein
VRTTKSNSGLGLAGDGNFYGLAPGLKQCIDDVPCGAIYRVTPATGEDKFVVSFKSPAEAFPTSLLAGPDGTLYGVLTSNQNGTSQSQLFHYDEVAGKLQTSALNVPIGGRATGTYKLILGPNENFYGLYDYYDRDHDPVPDLLTGSAFIILDPVKLPTSGLLARNRSAEAWSRRIPCGAIRKSEAARFLGYAVRTRSR